MGESDFEDPQVYESMCIIQTQAGSSETAQASDLGNAHICPETIKMISVLTPNCNSEPLIHERNAPHS